MNVNKPLVLYSAVALLSSSIMSCVYLSRNSRPDGVVVERNKETRPTWVDTPSDQLISTAKESRFHFALPKSRDLPIAIKKSQTAAIDASFNLWLPSFDSKIAEVSQFKSLKNSSKTQRDLDNFLNQFAHRIHAEIAQVEDIYFERIKIDGHKTSAEMQGITEYFDVHTLVHLATVDSDYFISELAKELKMSGNSELRRVGKDIQKTIDKTKRQAKKNKTTKAPK